MRRPVCSILEFVRTLAEDRVVTRIALVLVLVQTFACLWDLPGHGWENDGIAPDGVFDGITDNLVPGRASRYPLLHFVISLIASLPALLLIPVLSPSLSGEHLVATATADVPDVGAPGAGEAVFDVLAAAAASADVADGSRATTSSRCRTASIAPKTVLVWFLDPDSSDLS